MRTIKKIINNKMNRKMFLEYQIKRYNLYIDKYNYAITNESDYERELKIAILNYMYVLNLELEY